MVFESIKGYCRGQQVYGDGRAMLGTRGDIEIFKVDFRLFDEVVTKLKEVGLDPRDSCGNSVRNPIPCTSQFCPYAHINAEALSTFIGDYFRYRSEYEQPSLSHRIKISISACERTCAVPVAQDIGIVAKPNGKFDVYLGGGIGEHAFSAKLAFTDVDAEDLLPVCVGVAEVFRRSGERRGGSSGWLSYVGLIRLRRRSWRSQGGQIQATQATRFGSKVH